MTVKCTALLVAAGLAAPVRAQLPSPSPPLQLAELQRQAAERDPRARELALYARQADLRTANIEAERLPAISVAGKAQYQSDVPQFPLALPGGGAPLGPPHDTYDASVRVEERLVDSTRAPRLALERATEGESEARVRAAVYALRQQVNDAFYTAALLEARRQSLAAAITDLETRLRELTARVREGTALAGEAAAIEANLILRRQEDSELAANRHAALSRLSVLTGRTIPDDATLAVPDLGAAVASARGRLDALRERPEYTVFARTRDRISRQSDLAAVQDRPRASAFGTAGVGRPGLNFIGHDWEAYWLTGVQLEWHAWSWGSRERERQALDAQQAVVQADEAAFTDELVRAVQNDLAAIDRLGGIAADDDRIVDLRESIDRGAHARFRENVITAADYLERSTELADARYNRAAHRIQLSQAGARFLNTLGIEVP
jgi:outer membrane protein TolC